MKNFIVILMSISVTLLIACKNEKAVNPEIPGLDSIIDNDITSIAEGYTKAWNSQDPKQVAEFYALNGSLTVNEGDAVVGREALTEFAGSFMTSFPDMVLSLDSLVSKNNRIEYHWNFVGTNTGPGGTGNKVDFSGFESWELADDGLITNSIGTFDEDEYNRQVNTKDTSQ